MKCQAKNCLFGQAGFTLMELLVAMSLMVLLFAGFSGLLSTSVTSWLQGSSRTEVQQVARQTVDLMAREIQYSKQSGLVFTSATNLSLQTDQYGATQTINYYLNTSVTPNAVYRNDGTGARAVTGSSVVSVSITNLTFTDLGNGTVGVKMTAASVAQPNVSVQVETAVTALN